MSHGEESSEKGGRLAAELGAPLPAAIRTLDSDHLDHLADAMAHARRRQSAELAQAGERALRFVPRLLRGPLRKVLG